MSDLTQISLDFGPEHPAPASPPASVGKGDGTDGYMAAEGVGVRLKSYKRNQSAAGQGKPEPVNGDLFGQAEDDVLVAEIEMEPASIIGPTPPPEPKRIARTAPAPARKTPAKKSTPPKKSKRGRKSLKQVAAEADLIEIPDDEVLFSKQYYTMGEVSEMFRVNQSLLRFWETEFDILQPRKNKKGDRYFRPIDIKNLHLIYHLLRQKKYTIEGAKDFLKKNKKAEERFGVILRLQEIRAFLLEWKAQL
jgi:DNA-binding transcriptional MerR regulator